MKEKQRDEFNQSVLNAYMAISHWNILYINICNNKKNSYSKETISKVNKQSTEKEIILPGIYLTWDKYPAYIKSSKI
jgi:hypothetical protein